MTFDTWLAFAILEIFLCLTPGPAVLFVTTTSATQGARAGIVAAAGILASNLMYFTISGSGVAAVLLTSPALFKALRWGGSAYLLYLGLRMCFGNSEPATDGAESAPPPATGIPLLHGFMVQTLNPKAIAFFAALLPQFVDPAFAVAPQMLVLTLTSVLIEAGVLGLYIHLTLRFGRQAGMRGRLWFRRCGGAFLVLAALRLAVTS